MIRISCLKNLCFITLLISLTSCGFSLRGSDILPANFSSLQLNSQQSNSEFTRLLRRRLTSAEVEIFEQVSEELSSDVPVLFITNEQVVARPVSTNPRARAAQIELRLSVDIALSQSEFVLIEPETLFVERTYFEDIENISGNQEEVEIISAEMRRNLLNQLMRRLYAANISASL